MNGESVQFAALNDISGNLAPVVLLMIAAAVFIGVAAFVIMRLLVLLTDDTSQLHRQKRIKRLKP